MFYNVSYVEFDKEFRVCPRCDYKDGFHTFLRREEDDVKLLMTCPSCHAIFDVGWVVELLPNKDLAA